MNITREQSSHCRTPSQENLNRFFGSVLSRSFVRDRYARITRNDLQLNPFAFYLLSRFAFLANYKTRIANIAREKRQARYYRSKRTVNRTVSELAATGRIRAVSRVSCFIARTGRPINVHVLQLATDPMHAICVQFLLFLAFWRGDLSAISTRAIQGALGVDRGLALVLGTWLRSRGHGLERAQIRRVVFRCVRPYMGHRTWGQYCKAVGRFGNVPPPVSSLILSSLSSILTRTTRGNEVSRRPSTGRIVSLAGHSQTAPVRISAVMEDMATQQPTVDVRSSLNGLKSKTCAKSCSVETIDTDKSVHSLLTEYLPEPLRQEIQKRRERTFHYGTSHSEITTTVVERISLERQKGGEEKT